ncbi:SIR2 family protein [Mesorhizobium sp. B4-1-4]|uniref:SIR2 family protein n=1 Tax=Mesorhizobium sp. B4-1-4 TaxID=2589888 RepID=UPI001D014936|nr:SIR2 family protein [Mesorhizobium sp. B4-1-4]UCI34845.1 SIR2 family protein [Mesorhizobium sp. B4-1-4]
MRVGLPSFKRLTDLIYEELGETFEHDPPEKDAYDKSEYDRTLRVLEKRLHRPGTVGSPVRVACANQLRVPSNVELSAHASVLTLSQDRGGRSRILTTNFDTLFERALAERKLPVVSEAGKALPKPGGPRDFGIHHLHGRLADAKLGLAETDLILTSADFGDAYLRDGWASRYVEDRMRTSTLVLVGYRAEDAALRLLLESLDVDRERFPDLNKIYALERSSNGSAAQWRAKGVIPIEFATHDELYGTLDEWAKYAVQPADFERERIRAILAKPPQDTSEFEKSQLKFCLGRADTHASLVANNPSLSRLSLLAELKLVRFDDRWLATWIERNLDASTAVVQIVESLGLFGPETADLLEYRLNRHPTSLPDYLRLSWTLIIRHMRNVKHGLAMHGWYELLPRLNQGERSADMVERLTSLLRPHVKITKRFFLHDDRPDAPQTPSDLMSIGYEPDEDIQISEVVQAWSADSPAAVDEQLLQSLCHTLDATLNDAIEIGVESNTGYGTTDGDVPSVADHPQNAYRKGFLPIVRVVAEIWSRLADKDIARARAFVPRWIACPHRLNHRLAMFACTSNAIGPDLAGVVLQALPAGELFLTGGTVEVYRLLRSRWAELNAEVRDELEARLRSGPPSEWFREGSDVARYQDRSRYDLIGNLIRDGIQFSGATCAVFEEIEARWTQWGLRPAAQAGFNSWSESGSGEEGNVDQLEDVSDQDLVATALGLDAEGRFEGGQTWRALCQNDPDRALRGLEAEADINSWRVDAWQQLLWSPKTFTDADAPARVAWRLLAWPDASFSTIAKQASSWLEKPEALALEKPIWAVWDRIFAGIEPANDNDEDILLRLLDQALNVPIGRLTEVLLRKLPTSENEPAFATNIRPRLEAAVQMPARNGLLARVRLAVEVTTLFDRAPTWTAANIIPLFDWASPDAAAAWCARRFSRYIGTPELFAVTKAPFLQLFGKADMPEEAINIYVEWLPTILIANRKDDAGYALSAAEARAALRQASPAVLRSVGHRLAGEMEAAAPEEKLARWRDIVGPVFQGIWPLDIEMQTGQSTFKLPQILRATGEAFPVAIDVILPFVQPGNTDRGTSVYSLSDVDNLLFTSAPAKMLDLVSAVVGAPPPGSVFGLQPVLDRIRAAEPALAGTHKFQALTTAAAPPAR